MRTETITVNEKNSRDMLKELFGVMWYSILMNILVKYLHSSFSVDSNKTCTLHQTVLLLIFPRRYFWCRSSTFSFLLTTSCSVLSWPSTGLVTTGRFSAMFYNRDNFYVSLFVFLQPNPFWKRIYTKRKEFAPNGSKFFPFRVDLTSKWKQITFDRITQPLHW